MSPILSYIRLPTPLVPFAVLLVFGSQLVGHISIRFRHSSVQHLPRIYFERFFSGHVQGSGEAIVTRHLTEGGPRRQMLISCNLALILPRPCGRKT